MGAVIKIAQLLFLFFCRPVFLPEELFANEVDDCYLWSRKFRFGPLGTMPNWNIFHVSPIIHSHRNACEQKDLDIYYSYGICTYVT